MADYLGVSRNTIGNYIALRSRPNKGTVRLWAMATGVDLDWLAEGKVGEGDGGPDGGLPVASGGVPTQPYVAELALVGAAA